MKNIILLFLIFIFSLLVSCDFYPTAGPCIVIYNEPILHIDSVIAPGTNSEILKVHIYNIKIDDNEVPVSELMHNKYENIEFQDTFMVCTVPFSFGTTPGTYTFQGTVPEYSSKYFTILNVDYSMHEGGCPLYCDDGLRTELEF